MNGLDSVTFMLTLILIVSLVTLVAVLTEGWRP